MSQDYSEWNDVEPITAEDWLAPQTEWADEEKEGKA
jgi:hypothetical protein